MQQNSSRDTKGCVLQRTTEIAGRNSDPMGIAVGASSMQTNGIGHCSDDGAQHSVREIPSNSSKKAPPPNGKKTKGRVKIKMEFIDNKLRRYTTFSKRKTGIMKKAYELSTLTGTQVMLLVASETGHVYTFATRKLQPMITSEAGKALIQTCLNSPDPPLGPGGSGLDQRMSATGFEETDLTYSVGDDCEKVGEVTKTLFPVNSMVESPSTPALAMSHAMGANINPSTSVPLLTPALSTLNSTAKNRSKASSPTTVPTISMRLPHPAGFTTILASGGALSPSLQIGTLQTSDQNSNGQQGTSPNQTQTLYRLPQVPFVSISGPAKNSSPTSSSPTSSQNSLSVVQGSQQNLSVVSGNVMIPASQTVLPNSSVSGAVMYQTAQGLVYASPTSLSEGVILNLGQDHGNGTQQFITIPVSVSLSPAQQPQLIQAQGTTMASTNLPIFSSSTSNKKEKSKK